MYRIATTVRFALLVMIYTAVSCGGNSSKSTEKMNIGEPSVIQVSIGGMMCTDCEQTIQKSVSKVEGVKSVKASWKEGLAMVEYYPRMTDTLKIREAVTATGYTVKGFSPAGEDISK